MLPNRFNMSLSHDFRTQGQEFLREDGACFNHQACREHPFAIDSRLAVESCSLSRILQKGNDIDLRVGWAYNLYKDPKYGNDTGFARMTTLFVEGRNRK